MSFGRPRPTVRDLALVTAMTLLGGVVYYAAGVRFDASTFPSYMQFIDEQLLATKLLESLWYYHAHPPGLNVLAAIGVKAFGANAPVFFMACFELCGLVLAVATFALVLRLARVRWVAYLATALLVLSPAFVLYENWFMYTFLEATLLTAGVAALGEYFDERRTGWAVAAFGLLAALVLTRSLFHIAWLAIVVGYVVVLARGNRRQVLAASAVPLLVVALWYGKNWYLFGSFSSSSLLGLSLSNVATLTVPRSELQPLVDQGVLSPFSLVSRYEDRAVLFGKPLEPTGVAVLDDMRKSTGEYNYNYRHLLDIDPYYKHDALTVIKRFPANYVIALLISNRLFFSPTEMNTYFDYDNRVAALPFQAVFDRLLYGVSERPAFVVQPHFGFDRKPSIEVDTSVALIVLWCLVLPYGYLTVRRGFASAATATDRERTLLLGIALLTFVYVYLVSTTLELGENYRYRFAIEPLFFVCVAALATQIGGKVKAGLQRRRGAPQAG